MKTLIVSVLLLAAHNAFAANCFEKAGKIALALTGTETSERSIIEENYKKDEKTYIVTTGTPLKLYQYVITFKSACEVQNILVK